MARRISRATHVLQPRRQVRGGETRAHDFISARNDGGVLHDVSPHYTALLLRTGQAQVLDTYSGTGRDGGCAATSMDKLRPRTVPQTCRNDAPHTAGTPYPYGGMDDSAQHIQHGGSYCHSNNVYNNNALAGSRDGTTGGRTGTAESRKR